MTSAVAMAGTRIAAQRYVRNRKTDLTAPIRCKAYGLYSALLASPHEVEAKDQPHVDDWTREIQPYGIDLGELTRAYATTERQTRARDYSALFEIGDSGPPVAIREQQQFGDRAGIREDLVRFYDFFDYALSRRHAWAPDHLSVILEFCHFLCYRESVVRKDRLSYQLGQLDFASRHLVNWVPVLAERIETARPAAIYAAIVRSLHLFIARDHEWQASTVFPADGGCRHG